MYLPCHGDFKITHVLLVQQIWHLHIARTTFQFDDKKEKHLQTFKEKQYSYIGHYINMSHCHTHIFIAVLYNNWIFRVRKKQTVKYCYLIRAWYHYQRHSSTELLGKSLIHVCGESKCAGLGRNFTFPTTTSLNWSTSRKWILNDWRHSEPWDEPHMQENTDRAGVCRLSEVTAQVIKDAALYAISPGLVSFLQSVRVWSHSWFRALGGVGVRKCVWGAHAF